MSDEQESVEHVVTDVSWTAECDGHSYVFAETAASDNSIWKIETTTED